MTRTEVLTKALEGKIRWFDAAVILGLSARQVRRLKSRFRSQGIDFHVDRRGSTPRKRRIKTETLQKLLQLRREQYSEFSVRHFHEHAVERHGLKVSYGTALAALQAAGLAEKNKARGKYRRKRERRPMAGMMLHIDASTHEWLVGQPVLDLVAVVDDADGRLLYARLVDQEGIHSTLQALEHVLRKYGRFGELYHDRGTHYGYQRNLSNGDAHNAVQRVCNTLGIKQIYSLSPEARGRSERYFGTLQGRLPQELKLHGITTQEQANDFLKNQFIADMNRRFTVTPREKGSAFVRLVGLDMELVLSERHERVVDGNNVVHFQNTALQLPPPASRTSYARMPAVVHSLLDGTLAVTVGSTVVARFSKEGELQTVGRRGKRNAA